MPPRNYAAEQAGRNARARAEGWSGYGQKRRWLPRFQADQAGTAEALGRRCCHGHKEPSRSGSYLCDDCNRKVNPNIANNEAGAPRRGDWRARLVNAALAA